MELGADIFGDDMKVNEVSNKDINGNNGNALDDLVKNYDDQLKQNKLKLKIEIDQFKIDLSNLEQKVTMVTPNDKLP